MIFAEGADLSSPVGFYGARPLLSVGGQGHAAQQTPAQIDTDVALSSGDILAPIRALRVGSSSHASVRTPVQGQASFSCAGNRHHLCCSRLGTTPRGG